MCLYMPFSENDRSCLKFNLWLAFKDIHSILSWRKLYVKFLNKIIQLSSTGCAPCECVECTFYKVVECYL